jgi:hypothetical protein
MRTEKTHLVGLEPERRALNDPVDTAPVVVGVDDSARSIDALVLADVLAAALRTRLVIAHVHSLGKLSSVFSDDEHELIVRGIAESTFEQIRDYLPSVPERRLQLISEQSPAAGSPQGSRRHRSTTSCGASSKSSLPKPSQRSIPASMRARRSWKGMPETCSARHQAIWTCSYWGHGDTDRCGPSCSGASRPD